MPLISAPGTTKNDKIVPIVLMWAFRTALNEWKVDHSAKSADSDWIHYLISLYVVGESILMSHCYFGSGSHIIKFPIVDLSVRGRYCTGRIRSSSGKSPTKTRPQYGYFP
jgi:hypothetical protein